jgi:hypothetical protein
VIRRLLPATAVAVLGLGALVGCGGGDGGDNESDGNGNPSPSPTSETTTETDEPYLPVPAGVELTPPGTALGVGESAVVAWQPRQNLVGVLDIKVTRLEKTSFAESFEGWDVKAEQKKKVTPYFVHASVANRGDTNLSGRLVPLYAADNGDTLVEATKFTEEFKPCPGGDLPKGFSTDDSVEVCMVYLIAAGQKLAGVTFRPIQEFEPITWMGEIQRIEKPEDRKNQRDNNG